MVSGIRGRRSALGCCAALAMAGSIAYPAAAAPRPASAPLPPGLIAAVESDLGISAHEYLARAESARRLAEFAPQARAAYPDIFAGIRMNDDRPIVSFTEGERAADARSAAEKAGFTVETVANSEHTLDARRIAFERWLSEQPSTVVESIVGYGIDVVTNSFAVRLADDVQLPTDVGPIQSVTAVLPEARPEDSAVGIQAIAGIEADGDIIGGQPFGMKVDGKAHRCSFGFNATDARGETLNITAGHCDPNNLVEPSTKTTEPQRVYEFKNGQLGTEIGEFAVSQFAPKDYAIVRINEKFAPRFRNNLVSTQKMDAPAQAPDVNTPASSTGQSRAAGADVLRIDGTTEPVVGAAVCKTGFTSGYSCGTVLVAGQRGLLRGVPGHGDQPVKIENMFYAALCGQRGDSGGPIVAGTKALGLSSAIVTASSSFDLGCGHVPLLLGQPISAVLQDNPGLTIRTS
ncbi:S1 family peptidase [Nocardia anaemiae]|uniref:S1 family peptidase n=1 Tax=Nocardia anaemiae TaxID=263910 RepID=UPI0007A46459|nr:S1 family peptidase [Nocardia anaemiae]